MKNGDEIYVTDGKGHRFKCEIINSHPKHTEIKIIGKETTDAEREYYLTLAVAPTKNTERMEWMLEKAVEIGVNRIVLLKCARSERKNQRTDRLRNIMISAMKQSLSTQLPELLEMTDFDIYVNSEGEDTQKFFGYCSESFPRKEFVKECMPLRSVSIMIGPEGDFTQEEVKLAVEKGFIPVTFGNKRLRTETAGVFAVSAVNIINQLS